MNVWWPVWHSTRMPPFHFAKHVSWGHDLDTKKHFIILPSYKHKCVMIRMGIHRRLRLCHWYEILDDPLAQHRLEALIHMFWRQEIWFQLKTIKSYLCFCFTLPEISKMLSVQTLKPKFDLSFHGLYYYCENMLKTNPFRDNLSNKISSYHQFH